MNTRRSVTAGLGSLAGLVFAALVALACAPSSAPATTPAPCPPTSILVPYPPLPPPALPAAATAPLAVSSVTSAPDAGSTASTVDLANGTTKPLRAFLAFGADSVVTPASIPACDVDAGLTCILNVPGSGDVSLPLGGRYLNATVSFGGPVTCGTTKAELNVNNPRWYDTLDVSLVDGYSTPLEILTDDAAGHHVLGPVTSASGNEKAFGVFPDGCDVCVARLDPPCGIRKGKTGCKAGPDPYHPAVPCQYQAPGPAGGGMSGGSKVTVRRF